MYVQWGEQVDGTREAVDPALQGSRSGVGTLDSAEGGYTFMYNQELTC
jgi:hypothetical protein